VPRYTFTLPASGIPYSFAKRIIRMVGGVRSSVASKGEG
jgi:hypothetical protein